MFNRICFPHLVARAHLAEVVGGADGPGVEDEVELLAVHRHVDIPVDVLVLAVMLCDALGAHPERKIVYSWFMREIVAVLIEPDFSFRIASDAADDAPNDRMLHV